MKRTPLKRDTPKAKEWIARSKLATALRRTKLKQRGRKSAEKRKRDFGEKAAFVRGQPCDTCGAPPPGDPSHYPSRGAGGTSEHMFPQCRPCHRRMHDRGVDTFLAEIDRTRLYLCLRTEYWEERWREIA